MQKQLFFSDAQVAKRYGVSRATVWRWVRRGILPKPVSISPGCTRWRGDQLDERDAKREQAVA
jgi:predicted DNA-binding transcriptional regulator AlpA